MSDQELAPPAAAADEDDGQSDHDQRELRSDEADSAAFESPPSGVQVRMAALREHDAHRRIALVFAVTIGLLATTWHWFGLVVGGALVGLTRKSLPRALAAGLGFGVLVLLVLLATLQVTASVSPGDLGVLAPLSTLTVALTLLAPAWGALVRGVL